MIDVLGEVGGFIEIIHSFFNLICSVLVDILYENTLVNNLFSFNLKKKLISIKQAKKSSSTNDKGEIKSDNIHSLNIKKKGKTSIMDSNNDVNSKNLFTNNNSNKKEMKGEDTQSGKINLNTKNKDTNEEFHSNFKKSTLNKNNIEENYTINDIDLKYILILLCHCCLQKRKTVNKILLNESMNIITKKLDIFNIFRNICLIEYTNNHNCLEIIKMSKESSEDLSKILK